MANPLITSAANARGAFYNMLSLAFKRITLDALPPPSLAGGRAIETAHGHAGHAAALYTRVESAITASAEITAELAELLTHLTQETWDANNAGDDLLTLVSHAGRIVMNALEAAHGHLESGMHPDLWYAYLAADTTVQVRVAAFKAAIGTADHAGAAGAATDLIREGVLRAVTWIEARHGHNHTGAESLPISISDSATQLPDAVAYAGWVDAFEVAVTLNPG
jgi:hypothetical protein